VRILIAYDGSPSSEIALADLARAGLPEKVDAKLISIAEVWIPLPEFAGVSSQKTTRPVKNNWFNQHQVAVKHAELKAESLSCYAANRVRKNFPKWTVSSDVAYGSPAKEILVKAEDFQPDLIVVGSQGQTAVSRVLLGSISRKVLSEAKCSVRISRRNPKNNPAPLKQIIGYDGSPGSDIAVESVAQRKWDDSEFKLVLAPNSGIPATIGRFVLPAVDLFETEQKKAQAWAEALSESARRKLSAAKLKFEICVKPGNPKQVLIEEAENYDADCIIVGSHSVRESSKRFALGCTAAAIAERANCSVEVVKSD
jgi:nucleotide-binding universal stress UspA family protein